ncbi:phage tail assembly protein T [Chryseobacterium cucumeris]|uniref:phage tail assembly protein T n=1 Tax=Chryseobacterium cucumeris TaxID=1813611 RepID=UPI0023F2D431|nr:hypothetical protein [Chryseobacterium cucumeris]
MTSFRTVTELENFMSLSELYEWYEYYSEEPFLADRLEIQLATLCNMVGSFGKSKLKHSDYMVRKLKQDNNIDVNNPDTIKAMFSGFAKILN